MFRALIILPLMRLVMRWTYEETLLAVIDLLREKEPHRTITARQIINNELLRLT